MQIVREWSAYGQEERDKCFSPIIEELKSRFPEESRSDVRVLVPGCGLARLPFDIALEGFQVIVYLVFLKFSIKFAKPTFGFPTFSLALQLRDKRTSVFPFAFFPLGLQFCASFQYF